MFFAKAIENGVMSKLPHFIFNMKITVIALQDLLYQLDTSPEGVAGWLELQALFDENHNWKGIGGI